MIDGKRKFYYRASGKKKDFERAAAMEEDRKLMESYYPSRAGRLKALITDQCDRLDYEGSFIYDEYPDRRRIERLWEDICRQAGDFWEVFAMEAKSEESELLGEITGLLVCQEIHKRRCMRKLLQPGEGEIF